jgi:glutaredoxin
LFSLEQCVKCQETKELLVGRNDVDIVTFPHDLAQWREEDFELAKSHDVFEDLKKTAPVLWLDGKKNRVSQNTKVAPRYIQIRGYFIIFYPKY